MIQRLELLSLWLVSEITFAAVSGAASSPVLVRPVASSRVAEGFDFAVLGQLLAGLVLVLVVFMGLAWLLRRSGVAGGFSHQNLKVIATLPLGTRERIILVQAGSKQLLLGVAPGRVNLLESFNEPLVAPAAPETAPFAQWLQRAKAKASAATKPEGPSMGKKLSSRCRLLRTLLWLPLLLLPGLTLAEVGGIEAVTVTTGAGGEQNYSVTLQILILMTLLTFLPAIVMMMTSFTRIIVVFAILRQALGLQSTPSNQILVGLALFLTFFIMTPVLERVHTEAVKPYLNEELTALETIERAVQPFRSFMLRQTRESDIELFVRISGLKQVESPEALPLSILVPAFVTSELKTAFQIGFMLYIPFLIIDMVVASVLMAMGMMMLSPVIISLPFKLMLFVLVDGWAMVIGTLAASFGT